MTHCALKSIREADLVMMYSDLRKMMILMFPTADFEVEELKIENSERITRAELLINKRKIESQEKNTKRSTKVSRTK